MPKYRMKQPSIEARQLTVDNMEELARWCNGSIKGTSLPPEDRIIQIQSHFHNGELDLEVGDWIILFGSMTFHGLGDAYFRENFILIGE